MINVVIPMAGLGSRFVKAGFTTPKPFIEVHDTTLIELVLSNLNLREAKYFLLARSEHLVLQEPVLDRIKKRYDVTLVPVDKLTEGAACTVLHAHRLINTSTPLLLANSDQFVDSSIQGFVDDCDAREIDGSILTFVDKDRDPKWSFAKINSERLVTEVKEKVAISEHATVGIYYFAQGRFFVDGAIDMIVANDRVNGEFYTCPVYNYGIAKGLRFGIYNIDAEKMHGLGTPEDLQRFVESGPCRS
jgi:UDP-N-acetylglucosamine diphosphorylase / glucose-1-phosphate thymidylyltransferase / UDP-N-acetylgalactosamine diphosphorylase / glucosamine-1-phosphate N-acetyltransferase / galactosamine-1-phosphate N-acetyltransferase